MNARRSVTVIALVTVACARDRPPNEPAGTTRSTSAPLSVDEPTSQGRTVAARRAPATASAAAGLAETPADRELSERVRRELVGDAALRSLELDRIRVASAGGRVTIGGLVPTVVDKVVVEQRVRSVKGVEAVSNELRLLPPP